MAHVTINTTKSQQSEAMRKLRATQAAAHDALQRLAKDAREAIGVAEHWATVIDDLTARAVDAEARATKADQAWQVAETSLQHEKRAHSQTRKMLEEMRDVRDKLFLKYEAVGAAAPATVRKVDEYYGKSKQVQIIPAQSSGPKNYVACCGLGQNPWFVTEEGSKDMHKAVRGIPNKLSAVVLAQLINQGAMDLRPGDYTMNYTC